MVINTIICLIGVALAGFLRLRMRYDRILSWLMFIAVAFLFAEYGLNAIRGYNPSLTFLWSKTRIGDIMVDFLPSQVLNRLVVPLFFLSLMTIFNNNVFRYEEKRSIFNSLIILNFVTLCLLVSAENYVQLITAVFVSDILGYLILKDVDSSHRYVIYNLFADMCLFMILALVCGKIQSLDMKQFLNYKQIGGHRDFVGLIAGFAIFVKCGCFLFQSYLFDISSARFQRMSAVNLLFSPLVGILLLVKLHNLLTVSNLFIPFMKIMAVATFLFGIIYFITKDNIQKKMVSLNMAFIGCLMYMLLLNKFNWIPLFSYYLMTVYFFNMLFFKIYLYQNREEKVSKMLNTKELNVLPLQTLLLQMVILADVFFIISLKISESLPENILKLAILVILLALGIVLNHIYKSPHIRRLDYLNPNPQRILSFIVNTLLILGVGYLFEIYNWYSLLFTTIFLGVTALPIWKKLRSCYEKEWLQTEDVSKSLFCYVLVEPLKYISRILWLMVDFVFSEKIITAAFSGVNRHGVSFFFKLNQKSTKAGIIYIIIGILFFVLSFYRRYLP
ncbi:MAG: hypothetical protein NC218_10760 [Acetobacter sp.]|nr:hypothetical protein [Acetobacter sp.]